MLGVLALRHDTAVVGEVRADAVQVERSIGVESVALRLAVHGVERHGFQESRHEVAKGLGIAAGPEAIPFQRGHRDGEAADREALVGLCVHSGQGRQHRVNEDPIGMQALALRVEDRPVDLLGFPDRTLGGDASVRIGALQQIHHPVQHACVVGLVL